MKVKKYGFAVLFAIVLFVFTGYLLADTFLISRVYTVVEQAQTPVGQEESETVEFVLSQPTAQPTTQPEATEQAETTAQPDVTEQTEAAAQPTAEALTIAPVSDETSYSDGNIAIALSTYRIADTTVYVADVQLSSSTGGAVVDDALATSVAGIFACGNALHIHDIVDFASAEGDRAGANAARYALSQCMCAGNVVPIDPGEGMSYVVPQRIRRASIDAGDGVVTLFGRVRKPMNKPVFFLEAITGSGELVELRRKRERIAVPAEMVSIELDLAKLAAVDGLASLRLRAEGGE